VIFGLGDPPQGPQGFGLGDPLQGPQGFRPGGPVILLEPEFSLPGRIRTQKPEVRGQFDPVPKAGAANFPRNTDACPFG